MLALVLWQNSKLATLVVALMAMGLAAVLWLYPPALWRARRRWRLLLPVLRAMVIVALGVSLLRPVAARPRDASHRGPIVVLVDQSRSMGVTDSGRSPAEKIGVAEALGMLDPQSRGKSVAALRNDLESLRGLLEKMARHRGEAEYAHLAGRSVEPARARLEESTASFRAAAAVLADEARKQKLPTALAQRLAELKRLPGALDDQMIRELRGRLDQQARALAALEADADAAAYANDPDVRRVCNQIDSFPRIRLVQEALVDGRRPLLRSLESQGPVQVYGFADRVASTDVRNGLQASGDRSDLIGAIRELRDRLQGEAPQGVVLISDGKQVGGSGDVRELEGGGPPVFTVGVATARDRRDVSVTGVKGPASLLVGETAAVQVQLRAQGLAGKQLVVWLATPSGRQERTVTVGNSTALRVDFSATGESAGVMEVAAGVGAVEGEATAENNHGKLWLKVFSETIPVCVASAAATRDYATACDALGHSRFVSLGKFVVGEEDGAFPLTPEEILAQGVLVMMDVRTWTLSDAQWDAVQQLVSERGGSVVLLTSDEEILREYEDHPVAAKLLPFDPVADVTWRAWPGEQPRYSLVQAQWQGAIADEGEAPRWPKLPPVLRYLSMPQLKPNAQPLLVDQETGATALAQTRLGLGRAYFLGTDETWRWQTTVHEDLFWRALVRWSIEEPYAAREGGFSLDVDRVRVEAGQPLRVRARVVRDDGTAGSARSQELQVYREGQMIAATDLAASVSAGAGRYETTLSDLSPGQYELRLSTGDDMIPSPRVTVTVSRSGEAELADLSEDNGLLRRISQATGGEFVPIQQLQSLPNRLADLRDRQVQWQEYPLWDSPYLFLFVLATLSLEWSLRKQAGLT